MSQREIAAHHYATGRPVRVRWDSARITALDSAVAAPSDLWIAPALVDLQINGYGGIDFQQDNLTGDDLLVALRRLRADGCTRCLFTVITDEWPRMLARLRQARALRERSPELQHAVAGWHVEGPFLSAEPGYCGAHDPARMLDPEPGHLRELREAAGADPLLLTLAPERRNAPTIIREAVRLDMRVSLGHTNAPAGLLADAIRSGASANPRSARQHSLARPRNHGLASEPDPGRHPCLPSAVPSRSSAAWR